MASRKSMEHTFAARTRLRIDTLPEASQRWLEQHAADPAARGKLAHNAAAGPLLLVVLAVALQLAALYAGFASERVWDGGRRAMMLLLLVGAPVSLALAARLVVRVWRSPYGKFTTVHPCHILQVDVDRLTVWPLVNLHDVSLTHHSTNGAYSHTVCRLNFAGTVCNVIIRGQQPSVQWANLVLDERRKVLDRVSAGQLEGGEGFDFVPPALLQAGPAGPPAPKDPAAARWYGVAGALGAAMFAAAIPLNLGAGERHAWAEVSRSPSLAAYRDYVTAFPNGAHVAAARRAIDEAYDRALAQYQARAGATAPGAQAIVAVLKALAASGGGAVAITYRSTIDFSATKASPEPGIISADPAFSAAENKARERSITSALRHAFANVVGPDVVDLDDSGAYAARAARAPITFAVNYRVGPSGTIYQATTTTGAARKLYGIVFEWHVAITDGRGATLYETQLSSSPAKNIRYTTTGQVQSDILPYTKMAESAFAELGRKLAGDFGVAPPSSGAGAF